MRYNSGFRYFMRQPFKSLWKMSRSVLGQTTDTHTLDQLELPSDLLELFKRNSETEYNRTCDNMYHYGGSNQRQRIVDLARWSAEHYSGDFVEIGAFCGETSKLLAQVAAEKNRRLIVIDPWITGSQDCDGDEFKSFQKNIEPYRKHVDVWRSSSLDPDIIARLKVRPLSFAFVDGLHTLKACLSDILAAGHTQGVIAIDDTRYNHDLLFSVRHAASVLKRRAVQEPSIREAYLLPETMFPTMQ